MWMGLNWNNDQLKKINLIRIEKKCIINKLIMRIIENNV